MSAIWVGPVGNCDGCLRPIQRTFVDGKTRSGQWGKFCPTCRIEFGVQLGTGLGQKYEARGVGASRIWIKTAG